VADSRRVSPAVEAVQSVYDAWNEGGLELAIEALPEGIQWETPLESLEPEVVHGRRGAMASMRNWLEEWGSMQITDLVLEDFGDRVLASRVQRMTGRASGVAVEGPLYMLWTYSDGKLLRMQMFLAEDEARAALA